MSTLTGFVASIVVHSSAAALAHFGLTLEPMQIEAPAPAPPEHVVARSRPAAQKVADCPLQHARARLDKA